VTRTAFNTTAICAPGRSFRRSDRLIALQLRQPVRGGPRDDGHVVAAGTSQLKGEGAADVSGTEYSDAEP